MPIWSVLVPAWNSLCGSADKKDCSTALVTQNQYPNNGSSGQPFGKVDLGEIAVGEGRIRIAGEMFPDPIHTIDAGNDTRFGLASYALTYTSYIVFENLVEWMNPHRLEPRKPPYVTTLAFTEASAKNGYHTDKATIETTLVDDLGEPIAGVPLRLELKNPGGTRETVQSTSGSDGVARFTLTLDELPGEYGVAVSFAGSDTYLPSNATVSFSVLKETTLMKVGVSGNGSNRAVMARLSEDDGPSVLGRVLTFFADGVQIGQARTDRFGVAALKPPSKYNGGKHTYTVTFPGDTQYAASSGEATSR
jgi:hypothetical protein